jgi:hypothetical protein
MTIHWLMATIVREGDPLCRSGIRVPVESTVNANDRLLDHGANVLENGIIMGMLFAQANGNSQGRRRGAGP